MADEWGEAAPPQCSRAETIKRAWLSATGTSATRSTPFRTLYPPTQPFSLSISRSLSALPTTHRHAALLGATAFHSRRSLMSTAAALPSRLTKSAGENIRSGQKKCIPPPSCWPAPQVAGLCLYPRRRRRDRRDH